jgi:hypothetical protein
MKLQFMLCVQGRLAQQASSQQEQRSRCSNAACDGCCARSRNVAGAPG